MFTEPASHDGVDMVFSDELQASINQAMDSNCDNIDSMCFESIKGLMFNQKTELETRQSQLKHRRFAVQDISEEYKFSLWWRPKSGNNVPQCITSCQKAFKRLADTDSCKVGDGKVYLAGSGAINIECGTYSFTVHHHVQSSVSCRNHPLSAPKNDNVADGATSVESAIQTWCNDYDGHIFTGNSVADSVYRRWGYTKLHVPDRSSYWLRATPNGNNQQGTFVKDDCIAALRASHRRAQQLRTEQRSLPWLHCCCRTHRLQSGP
jgi:hypothetical protein